MARRFADGKASDEELDAAWDASRAAAWDASWAASWAAAWDASWAASWAAEQKWQVKRLVKLAKEAQ